MPPSCSAPPPYRVSSRATVGSGAATTGRPVVTVHPVSSSYPPPEGPAGPPTAPRPGPPSDPWGPPPPPPPGRSGSTARVVLVVGASLVVMVLLVATVVVLVDGGGSDTAVGSSGSTVDVPDAPAATPEAVAAILPELQAFVEEERGLEFTEPVDAEVLAPDEYEARTREQFDADIAEDRDDLERAAAQYEALGLLEPGTDIVDVLGSYIATGTAGVYDSETGELVVRGSELNEDLKVTLVHELTHALDDQVFGLDPPEFEDREDEGAFGLSALIEGNASRVDAAYVESLSPDEQLEYFRQAQAAADGVDFDAFPPILLIEQQFVYGNGLEFVLALIDDGGNDAVDAAFAAPPLTSEAVLEPDSYLEGEGREEVATPAAEGETVEEGVGGQFLLELLVNGRLGGDGVPEWVGDQYVVWEDGVETCVRIAYVGDLAELEDALSDWVERTGGTVDRVGDTVTVTGCTA